MATITFEAETLTTYQQDIVAWAQEQSRLIRAGRFDLLDLEHIADEIDDVGKSEARELENRMAVLIGHLLKYQYQPERRSTSWALTIREQRKRILLRLNRTPSLKAFFIEEERFDDAYLDGRLLAEKETGMDDFPVTCPWSIDEILALDWLPEDK
ncbi:MAG: DUF29 domain-containing protein [Methylococcaceae bacterium]